MSYMSLSTLRGMRNLHFLERRQRDISTYKFVVLRFWLVIEGLTEFQKLVTSIHFQSLNWDQVLKVAGQRERRSDISLPRNTPTHFQCVTRSKMLYNPSLPLVLSLPQVILLKYWQNTPKETKLIGMRCLNIPSWCFWMWSSSSNLKSYWTMEFLPTLPGRHWNWSKRLQRELQEH